MNQQDQETAKLIKQALPLADTELRRDLWPEMLRRMDEHPATIPWFDWVLLGALLAWFVFSPGGIPVFLYHL